MNRYEKRGISILISIIKGRNFISKSLLFGRRAERGIIGEIGICEDMDVKYSLNKLGPIPYPPSPIPSIPI
jgi:hypothetical protein